MSHDKQERHPFLDDLTPDAVMLGTLMRRPVKGRDQIRRLVGTVATLYASQTPTFLGSIGNRDLLIYDAVLTSGEKLEGIAVIEHNEDGSVPRVTVNFSSIQGALALSTRLSAALAGELGDDIFI